MMVKSLDDLRLAISTRAPCWNRQYYNFFNEPIVCVSGGFDPLTTGHVNLIDEAKRYGTLVAIVNGDSFLVRKKGYVFMEAKERARIVSALKAVDFALVYDSDDDHVAGAIWQLRPHIFCNGGDRSDPSSWHQEEVKVCKEIGCKMVGGVGGTEKTTSSSLLVERAVRNWVSRHG